MHQPVAGKKISCRNTRAYECNSSFPFVPACLATGVALRWDKTVRQVNERMMCGTLQWVVERTCILSGLHSLFPCRPHLFVGKALLVCCIQMRTGGENSRYSLFDDGDGCVNLPFRYREWRSHAEA